MDLVLNKRPGTKGEWAMDGSFLMLTVRDESRLSRCTVKERRVEEKLTTKSGTLKSLTEGGVLRRTYIKPDQRILG